MKGSASAAQQSSKHSLLHLPDHWHPGWEGAMQGMIMSLNRVNNSRAIPSVTLAPSPLSLKGMKIQLVTLTGKLVFDWVALLSRLHWTQCRMKLQRKFRVALGFPINGPTAAEKPTFEPAEWLQLWSSRSCRLLGNYSHRQPEWREFFIVN